jgi:peptidoglycan/xylan/chitin deacetylase (PgdA/CDA1 family)
MRLRSLARRGTRRGTAPVVLLYHRIAHATSDPQLLCVKPEHFAQHVEVVAESYQPVRLRDLVAALRAGELPSRAVAITFDDGYADNLAAAKPVLEQNGVPATVFVASGWLGGDRMFWWDELEILLLRPGRLPPVLKLELGTEILRCELGDDAVYTKEVAAARSGWTVLDGHDPGRRQQIYRELCARLRTHDEAARERMLDSLRSVVERDDPADGELPRPMNANELRRLAGGDIVDIGAHTITHPTLSKLEAGEQRGEIAGSRRQLETALARPVASFAYPYGGASDFDETTARIVRDAGFDHACANVASRLERGTDAYRLPRVLVRDWSGRELARRLADPRDAQSHFA